MNWQSLSELHIIHLLSFDINFILNSKLFLFVT